MVYVSCVLGGMVLGIGIAYGLACFVIYRCEDAKRRDWASTVKRL